MGGARLALAKPVLQGLWALLVAFLCCCKADPAESEGLSWGKLELSGAHPQARTKKN